MSDHWQVIEDALTEVKLQLEFAYGYNSPDNVRLNVDRIDAALAFVREMRAVPSVPDSRQVEDAPQYSHRNGETEPPTIAGHYWFRGKMSGMKESGLVWVVKVPRNKYEVVVGDYRISIDQYIGEWHGPITPPWD